MPNRRGITGPGPADSTADVVFMHDDVAERGFHPCGFGHMVQLCGRVGPGGQDLGHVTTAVLHAASSSPVTNAMIRSIVS